MAMTMKEKASQSHVKTEWPAALKTEFAREAEKPNGCVGSELLSETEKLRVWTIRLKPGERIIVNGLQRVRPGTLVAPQVASAS